MRRATLALVIVALAAAGPPAAAEMCAFDVVPAATLLLPYFEVDLDADPNAGVNTFFAIHNALPTPTIAHVALWTDWSQPVLDFDIFLTGYDAETVDLYDVLVNGNLPVTADEQSDLDVAGDPRAGDPTSTCDGTEDSCSPHHSHPSWDGSFDGADVTVAGAVDCADYFPFFVNPVLSAARLADLQAKLIGQPVAGGGLCFGADHGDNVARGYVTIDNANACSLIFPSDPDYFSGLASNVNQLWGEWALIDPQMLLAKPVDPLIHIEADDAFDSSSTPTNYTFYGRYTQSLGGIDNREPLGSAWGISYYELASDLVDDLVVWRDSTANNQDESGFTCGAGGQTGAGPDWQPLDQTQVACFDQRENVIEICTGIHCFPLETQRRQLGDPDLTLPYMQGWCFLNLNIPGDAVTGDVDFPAEPPGDVAQSWVGVTHREIGVISGGFHSVLWAHACEDVNPVIGGLRAAFETAGKARSER